MHFCPHAGCDYRGWLGLGNLRANGHPSGGPWRQLYCRSCHGYFLETHGTIFHGKRLSVELIIRVLACLAEGLGIRATARVFEVDPNTVPQWLVAAAEQLQAFTSYFLCDMHVTQLQLDELYAVIRALKTGEISEDDALKRLEGSRPWVWTAIDPVSKVLLAIAVGPRTVEMAQRVVHQVAQRLASSCMPLWLSDGFTGYLPAILGHCGVWHQPERTRAQGPAPKPRWLPLPGLLYAQVVKQYRRKRMVGGKHRVVFGTIGAIAQVLSVCGWKINTAFSVPISLRMITAVFASIPSMVVRSPPAIPESGSQLMAQLTDPFLEGHVSLQPAVSSLEIVIAFDGQKELAWPQQGKDTVRIFVIGFPGALLHGLAVVSHRLAVDQTDRDWIPTPAEHV